MTNYGPYISNKANVEDLIGEKIVYHTDSGEFITGEIVGCFSKSSLLVAIEKLKNPQDISREKLRYRYPLDLKYIKNNYLVWFGNKFDTLEDYQIRAILKENFNKLKQAHKRMYDQLMQNTNEEIMRMYKY